jgi:cytochrome P450/deferrochelatase/peroxidase EfeB
MRLIEGFDEIQASILNSHGEDAVYHFLTIADPAVFRAQAAPLLGPAITTQAEYRSGSRKVVVGLGVTSSGLAKLGVPGSVLAELPEAFVEGMANRADLLGDTGASDPLEWEPPFGTGAVELVIWLWGTGAEQLDRAWRAICVDRNEPPGTHLLRRCPGAALWDGSRSYRVDPFGHRDSLSQPLIDTGESPDDGVQRIAPGEFVLGYPSEADGDLPGPPPPPATQSAAMARRLERNGSYMVFRKVETFRERFDELLDDSPTPEDRQLLRAEMLGRWPGGAVLRRGDTVEPSPSDANDFRFSDPGIASPRGAHVRRANPRDELPERIAKRHRILRRGIPYAEGDETGLLFVCFNARIDDQYELIQSQWLNGGNPSGFPSNCVDPIASSIEPATRVIVRSDGKQIHFARPLTRVRGGEYLLVPARKAFAKLIEGFDADPPAREEESELFDPTPALVRQCLLGAPVPRRIGDTRDHVWFVGTHAGVRTVLEDEVTYTIAPYRERVGQVLDGESLMISSSDRVADEAPIRRRRIALLGRVFGTGDEARVASIARTVLQRIQPGRHDVVGEIARAIPLAVAEYYLGVKDDGNDVSATAIAAHFGRTPPLEVPAAWAARREKEVRDGGIAVGTHNLAFWTRILFLETFVNLYEAGEPKAFAHAAALELMAHLDRRARLPMPGTVFERALGIDPHLAKLLAFELAVGGTDTVALAITNMIDLLLSRPDALRAARAAVREGADDARLDRIVVECLRLAPPAGLLLRRCGPAGARLEGVELEPRALVAALTAGACMDPRVFGPDPRAFDGTRDAHLAPVFGAGAHGCRGEWLALAQLREVLRFVLGPSQAEGDPRFRRVRRAAGPRGRRLLYLRLPLSLYVWFD